MKKIKIILALLLAAFFLMARPSAEVLAKGIGEISEDGEEDFVVSSVLSPSVSAIATDDEGNRFYVSGMSLRGAKRGEVRTGYETIYYYGGTNDDRLRVDAMQKNLYVNGGVSLLGGGSGTLADSAVVAGASHTLIKSQDYLYAVTFVYATHSFSFNGASWTGATYQ